MCKEHLEEGEIEKKLKEITNKLQIKHGKFDTEIPEMLMSIQYLHL